MNKLENTYKKSLNIENKFTKKRILFIPSESYDSATICLIEGLNNLGFDILVYKKSNINSWFCNKIIDNLDNIENNIDFVLSNLHWGTRWSLYNKLKHNVPYILIDGDDRIHGNNISDWKDKYNNYIKNYKFENSEEIKNRELSPYRWMEEIGNYSPDIVFMSQKYFCNNNNYIYLPFGIHNCYYNFNRKMDKIYDITFIPGPGEYRDKMHNFINYLKNKNPKLNIFNEKIYGKELSNINIKKFIENDNNIHSWHRWKMSENYFNIINQSKIVIYTPVDKYNAPGWESKRPYEILSQNTILLFFKQNDFDNSEYSLNKICDICEFSEENYEELVKKIEILLNDSNLLKIKREECYNNSKKYFTSIPISRYFLYNISNKII